MPERPDRTLGPVEPTSLVEQTSSIGSRVNRKKDSTRRQRNRHRDSGGTEQAIAEEREQVEKGHCGPEGHVDYRA